jgi:FkbM family methyltransferase
VAFFEGAVACHADFSEAFATREKSVPDFLGRYQFFLDLNRKGLESSFYYFRPECYEQETQAYMREYVKKGMTVIDIGAHIGFFTILLADSVGKTGKVYSLEPERSNFDTLEENIKINHLSQVYLLNVAASDTSGIGRLRIAQVSSHHSLENSSLAVTEAHEPIQEIETIALDDFFDKEKISSVDLVKIDAEGNEGEILKGARNSLLNGTMRQVICEVHSTDKQSPEERDAVRKTFYEHGYRSYVLNPRLAKKAYLSELTPAEKVTGLQNLLFKK